MANRAHIKYVGDPATLKKNLRPEVKAALQEIVSEWHDEILPVHFTERGRRRYGYRARTRKHRNMKRKKYGHQNPLVCTGNLKRTATRRARITGSAKSARATMSTPWYATRRFHGNDTYADEMTATTLGESRQLAKDMKKILGRRLNRFKKQTKR